MARRTSRVVGVLLMALQSALVTFALNTTTGSQSVTGVGFEGAVLVLWTTRQTASGVTDGTQLGIGIASPTHQACRSVHHPDNESATTSALVEHDDRIIRLASATSGATPAIQVDAALDSFTANGFVLDINTTDGVAILCHALVIGGENLDVAFSEPVINAATVNVTGVGFQSDAFIALGGTAGGNYLFGAPYGSVHGLGFSDGSDNACSWALGRGTGGAADTARGQRLDRLFSTRDPVNTGAAEQGAGHISAVGADGFTVTRDSAGTTAQPFILCLKGVQVAVGAITQPAAGVQTISVPFRARALLLQTHGTTAGDNVAGYGLALGGWALNGAQGSAWGGGTDAADPSVYARSFSDTRAIQIYTEAAIGSASVLVGDAEVTGVDSEGIELTWHTSDATARQILYFAIGAADDTVLCTGGVVPAVDDPADGDEFTGLGPHEDRLFIETDLDDDEVARWALQTPMRDSPDLASHPGFKAGVITQIGSVIRRTTGRLGAWQASSVRWAKDDHDKVARDLFDRLHWYGREFRVYLADRLNVAEAWILGRFFTSNYEPTQGFSAEIEGLDVVGSEFSPLALDRDITAGVVFDVTRVPEAPAELLQQDPPQPIPVYMGRWSDEASEADPPIPFGLASRGTRNQWNGGAYEWCMGFASITDGPAAPLNLTASVEAGGSISEDDLPFGAVYAQCWDVTGDVEGDPYPFLPRGLEISVTGTGRKIVLTITPSGGPTPDARRVALATKVADGVPRWIQIIEVDGSTTEVTFDAHPALVAGSTPGPLATGATATTDVDRRWYRACFIVDGERTAPSVEFRSYEWTPYQRPHYISLIDPGIALDRVELYFQDHSNLLPITTFTRRLSSPIQVDADGLLWMIDDFTGDDVESLPEGMPAPQGLLPVYDTGDVTFDGQKMARLVVHRWPGHRILGVYAGTTRLDDDHPDIRHPDHVDWPLGVRYITLGDTDCTAIYVRVGSAILTAFREDPETNGIRVNACTTEDIGDGTGSTISQSAYAVRHLLERLVLQDHKSGIWPASPTFTDGTPIVRGSDFEAARLMQIQRVGGEGYSARIALDTPTTLGQFWEWVVQSYGLHGGIGNHGQIRAGHYDDAVDTTAGYPHFTHIRRIKGHLTITPLTSDYENAIPSEWDYRPATRSSAVRRVRPTDMVKDDASIARNFGKRRVGPMRSLKFAADEATWTDVMQRNLLIGRFVNEWVSVPTDITALGIDLFSVILISDPEGMGATGYNEAFILVLEHEVLPGDPSQQRPTVVVLKGLNITKLIDAAWVWAPDATTATWDGLTDEQKGLYAGWADTDDTIPSDDANAKEWR